MVNSPVKMRCDSCFTFREESVVSAPRMEAPPKQSLHWQKAVIWLSLGFVTIIVLTWCDAIFDFAHFLTGSTQQSEHASETALKTVIILMLWVLSAYKVYRVVSRLSYLENFVHLCAWCRRIERDSRWLTLEEHFLKNTGQSVSHGMCPECAQRMRGQKQPDAA